MNTSLFPVLALISGGAIALQAGINAQLGVALNNTLLGTTVAFLCSTICCVLLVLLFTKQYPSMAVIAATPFYLWFGGIISAVGITLLYFLIPKLGVGPTISYALAAQVIVAMLLSHFGLFELPVKAMSKTKIIGAFALVVGALLVNWER